PGAPGAPAPRRCPNCGAAAPGEYCGDCGQRQRDRLHTSLRELVGEGLEELFDWDSRVSVTLRRLLLSPGFLTAEYLAGRRARYLRPLRLYLTASVVLFVVLSLTDGDGKGMMRVGAANTGGAAASPVLVMRDSDAPPRAGTVEAPVGPAIERFMEEQLGTRTPEELSRIAREGMTENLPKAFFLLLPVFALLLRLLHARRSYTYAEHLIFALHVHAFAFIVFAVGAVVTRGPLAVLDPLFLLVPVAYLLVAMRRVYGRSWARTAGRLALLVPTYGALLVAGMLASMLLALVLA
ncbi:MAG TPA: DUF3667 domain-containing protein, partial [Gemmatimonadales bacterium]